MLIQLHIVGGLLILLALLHFVFPKYFKWKEELSRLSLINRQMFLVHSFFIALVVFLMGILCLSSGEELLTTSFGRRVSLGISVFWTVRLVVQFFGYSPVLWRGKRFETIVHILFTLFWAYLSVLFLLVGMGDGL